MKESQEALVSMARYICLVFKYTAEPIALCIDIIILGDPGADSRGEGKSKRAGKYGSKKSKERREDNVLPDQFQTVSAVLTSDWAEKHKSFLAPMRSHNGGDRLELVW